eukprot:TRINITY_DN9647_c0_g1_i4.p1 TRINITY_DN9647_c0_g1~~TRINITY_DN9647_c0_g1_i4.p1  ORF type:complete len:134 (-),score=36.12 TRINITY_DN9647_c0_g1_i4:97-498(-)
MSTKVYQCTQCKAENFAWRDTCFKCKKWATGSEETYWKKRSASGKRRENKEKAKGGLDMDKVAQKVVELMAQKDGEQNGGHSAGSAGTPSKPTKPSQDNDPARYVPIIQTCLWCTGSALKRLGDNLVRMHRLL